MAPNKPPVSDADLERITREACDETLAAATSYDHPQTETWNGTIINRIISGILSHNNNNNNSTTSSSTSADSSKLQYKYAVNSTIIQHLSDGPMTATHSTSTGTGTDSGASAHEPTQVASPPTTPGGGAANGEAGTGGAASVKPGPGRRGMHSATGAYWNAETDGMWSYKYEGGESKGMDVVISVIYMAV